MSVAAAANVDLGYEEVENAADVERRKEYWRIILLAMPSAQDELQVHGVWELGGRAEPAPLRIKAPPQMVDGILAGDIAGIEKPRDVGISEPANICIGDIVLGQQPQHNIICSCTLHRFRPFPHHQRQDNQGAV